MNTTHVPYQVCFECQAEYATPGDLVAVANARLPEPGDPKWTDAREVRFCPECLHDFLYPPVVTLVRHFNVERPEIVCLCGSTRFFETFREQNLRLTLAGLIVLSIGCDTKSDDDLGMVDVDDVKARLDMLHKRKIDLCDWVFVLDVDGYLGASTRSEIDYATQIGRPIRYLSVESGCVA